MIGLFCLCPEMPGVTCFQINTWLMMKKLLNPSLFLLLLNLPASSSAQNEQYASCGTGLLTAQLYAQNPGLQEQAEANQRRLLSTQHDRAASPPTYIIPVVFHVIHNYGLENISDAQILDAVTVLNEDFRHLNADTSQIVSPFDTIAADCEIEFRLAQVDPNGNCTNGIDRIASLETNVGDDGSKLNQWPRDRYLNIWVVKQIANGVAGYAYFPYSVDPAYMAPNDGIVIRSDYVGRIGTGNLTRARSLTHEIGHYLGLKHLNGNCIIDGDNIADTPLTRGWIGCPLTNNDSCISGVPENVQNFMEYSSCMKMFTRGQRDFMQNTLNSSIAQRSNLWTTANLILTGANNPPVTCAPHADFKVNRRMICEGGSVTLTDLTWSSSSTSRIWTITGPDTLITTLQNPTLALNTTGSYHVQLIASNSAGTDTITKMNFITVSSDTATFNYDYSESFELPNTFYFGYISNDGYGNGSYFTQTLSVGHTGTGSVIRPFGNSVEGDVDELITPSYFLDYNTNIQLSFVYAYVTADTTPWANTPTLKVYSSLDCGQTWNQRWTRTGPALGTAGFMIGNFIPAGPADWDTVIINLNSMIANPNVRFKFEFTAPNDAVAGNLYIDDINVLSTNVGIEESQDDVLFSIYPNPTDGKSTISYSLAEQNTVNINIYDISGRLVRTVYSGEQQPGEYNLTVTDEAHPLAPGTYMVQMMVDDKLSTRKFVVTE